MGVLGTGLFGYALAFIGAICETGVTASDRAIRRFINSAETMAR
jgi:hypothetical protein